MDIDHEIAQDLSRERYEDLLAERNELLAVLKEVAEYLEGSNYATDSGSLPRAVRAAITKAESK